MLSVMYYEYRKELLAHHQHLYFDSEGKFNMQLTHQAKGQGNL
jgi:hypothetical protein